MDIESTTNPRVKGVKRLHRGRERRSTGRTLLEGPKLLEAALAAGVIPIEIFTTVRSGLVERAEERGAAVYEVSRAVLEAISTTVEPQDPVSVIETPASGDLQAERTVVLVEIADPGNMGTLIRTAAALGWRVALLGGADPWSPKVLRSGAGAHFAQPLISLASVAEMRSIGLATAAAVVSGGIAPEHVAGEDPIALLVGSEAHGLSNETVGACDWAITIPMDRETESLNVSIAGAIAMYALSRSD